MQDVFNSSVFKISTHTPLARRDKQEKVSREDIRISTHTPLARRDPMLISIITTFPDFYSHASCEA